MDSHYFVVWNEGGNSPTVRHGTLESAQTEALRLAAKHPGQRFVVLHSLGHAIKRESEWCEHDQIPF